MFMGDKTLRKAGEEIEYTDDLVKEYIKCKTDIIYFAEKYFKIITIDDGEILIKLWEFQKRMLKGMVEPTRDRRHNIILSSRQIGKSTISTVYILWYLLFNKHKTIAVLGNKEKIALEILRRIKLAYQNLPLWLQQGIMEGGWNKQSIMIENGSRILAASTASSAIRGESINFLYLDEFAFVPNNIADDFMSSVYPTISSGKTSKIIIVSTPHGMNHFYNIWRSSIRGENSFMPIKIRWDEVPHRDLAWKEEVIRDIGIVKWNQEYEAKFLGSSSTLIDPEVLERIELKNPIGTKIGSLLEIWEFPIDNVMYILGVDSAKGVGKDYSVIQVLKIMNEHEVEQVAMYRYNTVSTYDFAQICITVSNYYNECYMMIENNAEGGEVANHIWHNFEIDRIINTDKKGIGTRSTRKSKLTANLLLKRYLENGWLTLKDKMTTQELSRYEEVTPNVFKCGDTYSNDDTVTALLWGLFFLSTPFFDGGSIGVHKIQTQFEISDDEQSLNSLIIFDNEDENIF